MDVDASQQFVSALLKPSGQASAPNSKAEANNVEELYDVLFDGDITASTSGESVTEQSHSLFSEQIGSGEMEEAAEVGFSLNTGDQHKKGHKEQLKANTITPALAAKLQGNFSQRGLSEQHLKVFIPELSSKYNLDILEAVQELDGLDVSLPNPRSFFTSKALHRESFSMNEGAMQGESH